MKRIIVPVGVMLVSVFIVFGIASAQQNNIPPPDPNCAPVGHTHLNGQRVPTSIEPEFSIWCYAQRSAIPATRASGANDWVDTFDNTAPSITHLDDHDMGYRVFNVGATSNIATGYFVNVNHWMIDIADVSENRLSGGVLVAPDRNFSFENGKLVVEVDAAAGSDGMGGADRFYEIDLTPAAAPTQFSTDTLYGYGSFGGVGALGCRLERNSQGPNFVCAMYDSSNRVTGGECPRDGRVCADNGGRPGRVWETQGVGTSRTAASVVGGFAQYRIPGTSMQLRDVWRQCAVNELDLHCRDRFRMEITKDSIHLFVNGYPAMTIDGLFAQNPDTGADNRIPDAWFSRGVRPYFSSWINGGQHTPTRWHWDRIAVNPHAGPGAGNFTAPSAAPSFCLGLANNTCPDPTDPNAPAATATPTATVRTVATSTPTQTPRATSTSTPTATPTPRGAPTSTPTSIPGQGNGGAGQGAQAQTLTFNDLSSTNRPLNGQYPSGVVDWGTNNWFLSKPFGLFTTNSIGFNGAGPTSESLAFVAPRRLLRMDAYNGGRDATTVTVSCAGQPTVRQTLSSKQMVTIATGWSAACSTISIGSTNGWSTNFDNLVIDSGTRTINFDDLTNRGRPLSGQYPTGVIDWGSNGWFLSGPFGAFQTNSIGFNGPNPRTQGFGLITPAVLVQVDAYNGGPQPSVVTLACPGQPTVSVTVGSHALVTIATNWTRACSTVTVGSSNGWQTNFDNLVIQ